MKKLDRAKIVKTICVIQVITIIIDILACFVSDICSLISIEYEHIMMLIIRIANFTMFLPLLALGIVAAVIYIQDYSDRDGDSED